MPFLDSVMSAFGGMFKALQYIKMFNAVHWRKPSESPNYETCAVCDLSLDVDSNIIKWVAIVVNCLKSIDPNVDTDHPVFMYMSEQYEKDRPAALEVTISIKKREV